MSNFKNTRIYCKGIACPVKSTCLRFTKYINCEMNCVGGYTVMRMCTNQKRYVQDVCRINTDSKRL